MKPTRLFPTWRMVTSAVLIIVGNSCASVDYGLYRPGATEDEFHQDETECRRELGLGRESSFDPSHLLIFLVDRYQADVQTCLQEKGWKTRP